MGAHLWVPWGPLSAPSLRQGLRMQRSALTPPGAPWGTTMGRALSFLRFSAEAGDPQPRHGARRDPRTRPELRDLAGSRVKLRGLGGGRVYLWFRKNSFSTFHCNF